MSWLSTLLAYANKLGPAVVESVPDLLKIGELLAKISARITPVFQANAETARLADECRETLLSNGVSAKDADKIVESFSNAG